MDTYFASPERADEKELISEITTVSNNPVMSGLLNSISGLLAVLDEHRQIVAVNDSFLKMLGVNNASDILGLRPGEALQCIHAHEEPAGCGTSKFCSTCGAAIAIVSSLGQDKPVERTCALTANRGGRILDIALLVRSHPIKIDSKRFLLLFLQDITLQQQRAALERTFFHDVNNLLNGLIGSSTMLSLKDSQSDLVKLIHRVSLRLKKEVDIQKSLLQDDVCIYQPLWHDVDTGEVMEELQAFFVNHPLVSKKILNFQKSFPVVSLKTDMSLLLRILCNMIVNALEATDKEGEVKVWLEENDRVLSFCVWNRKPISQEISRRIFQRNFTTKEGDGRGVGTYSMKLFGEQILGGRVSFTTSREKGTVFRFSLQLGPQTINDNKS